MNESGLGGINQDTNFCFEPLSKHLGIYFEDAINWPKI